MKFTTKPSSAPRRGVDAFTLAEVLAALVFMAIVIPVALQGLQIASRAGTVAERKREAARVAERVLNEIRIVTTNSCPRPCRAARCWRPSASTAATLRTEAWTESAMQLLSVDVTFPVQGKDYTVPMSTLVSLQ